MGYPNVFATQPAGNVLASLLDANFSFALAKDGSTQPTAGMPFFAGTVSLPGIYFGTDTSSGLYRIGLNEIGLAIAGVKIVDISATAFGITNILDISSASAGNIQFPAIQNPAVNVNTLDDYREVTYTGTLTGCTTAPTGTISGTKIGNEITLNIPAFTATSNATSKTVTGMPAILRPATQKAFLSVTSDNGAAFAVALLRVETTGDLTFFPGPNGGAWTNSGVATMNAISVAYTNV